MGVGGLGQCEARTHAHLEVAGGHGPEYGASALLELRAAGGVVGQRGPRDEERATTMGSNP